MQRTDTNIAQLKQQQEQQFAQLKQQQEQQLILYCHTSLPHSDIKLRINHITPEHRQQDSTFQPNLSCSRVLDCNKGAYSKGAGNKGGIEREQTTGPTSHHVSNLFYLISYRRQLIVDDALIVTRHQG